MTSCARNLLQKNATKIQNAEIIIISSATISLLLNQSLFCPRSNISCIAARPIAIAAKPNRSRRRRAIGRLGSSHQINTNAGMPTGRLT